MNKELKSQNIVNPFVKHSISLRVGDTILSPNEVTSEFLTEKTEEYNKTKRLSFLPDFLNIELLDPEKVLLFHENLVTSNSSIFEKMENKTLYLNNAAFNLYPAAPSNNLSFTKHKIKFEIGNGSSDLVFLSANFENLVPLSQQSILEIEEFVIEKNKEIKSIETTVSEAEKNEDFEALSNLYTQLRELKYARFSAFKLFKINYELLQDEMDKKTFKLDNLDSRFEEYLVPPIH